MQTKRLEGAAFEVSRNGRRLCVAGLDGRPGVVTAILSWVLGEHGCEARLQVGGLDSDAGQHVDWVHRPVRVGDEISMRVVTGQLATRSRHRRDVELNSAKHEKAWLRKLAKKHGYKLVKLPPPGAPPTRASR